MNTVRFLAVLLVGLTLVPSLAHLLVLRNKIGMNSGDYLVVQSIYLGWAWLGIVIVGALLSTLALAVLTRGEPAFVPAVVAFVGVAAAHAIFWIFTFPVNQQTHNWTVLPENWTALRAQWEYSHAAGSVLTLIAFAAVIVSVLRRQ